MSTLAAGDAQGATQPLLLATTPDGVLAAYADHIRGLAIGPDAKRIAVGPPSGFWAGTLTLPRGWPGRPRPAWPIWAAAGHGRL